MRPLTLTLPLFCLLCASCRETENKAKDKAPPAQPASAAGDWKRHARLTYQVIREYPHDPKAFTQGLLVSGGDWIESTGGYGTSDIRRVERSTGKVAARGTMAAEYFGEGVAELDGKLYQLTWKNGRGFVYDAKSLQAAGSFSYSGEGWGLTTDGKSLILSDGSDRLRVLDPQTFRVIRELAVRFNGKAVGMLNELEWVEGEIFANIWHQEVIVRIDPATGNVIGVIDLSGIDRKERRLHPEHVLNGIAYDAEKRELFVTGKCWPKIYQVRLVPAP